MRDSRCPLCGSESNLILQLNLSKKGDLPSRVSIRHCNVDNFLFVANGSQEEYDAYYASIANDSYHSELAEGSLHSPIAQAQYQKISAALDDFFDTPKSVLDFGCGEASLLAEIASNHPSSMFWGYDPSPAIKVAREKAKLLKLNNLMVSSSPFTDNGSYDLIILSHVLEHLIDFELLDSMCSQLHNSGVLYIEVPDTLRYPEFERREFLYYFDRIHVNHFTPQTLSIVTARRGLAVIGQHSYSIPYRDGGEYPVLGMLFQRAKDPVGLISPSALISSERYIAAEKTRATVIASKLERNEGVLVWGTGDNFHRSVENDGPLSGLRNMVVLDRRPQEIVIAGERFQTENPLETIRNRPWPVVITISEGRDSLLRQVKAIDQERMVIFV